MKMIFEAPATVWQEAFPLGNGRIGALMFGDGEAETLCLNEDTLWSVSYTHLDVYKRQPDKREVGGSSPLKPIGF